MVAVNDGRIVRDRRTRKRLGRFIQLQDVYGNTYTYAGLGEVADTYPAPRSARTRSARSAASSRSRAATRSPRAPPRRPARRGAARAGATARAAKRRAQCAPDAGAAAGRRAAKQRLFANPRRPQRQAPPAATSSSRSSPRPAGLGGRSSTRSDYVAQALRKGARVIAGTVLGRIGSRTPSAAPHLRFEIRPAGRGAPRIDPKPILDGWKLLESTAIYRPQEEPVLRRRRRASRRSARSC